ARKLIPNKQKLVIAVTFIYFLEEMGNTPHQKIAHVEN
ncbi:unnamed protein product, partial [marine sediment metagenome]